LISWFCLLSFFYRPSFSSEVCVWAYSFYVNTIMVVFSLSFSISTLPPSVPSLSWNFVLARLIDSITLGLVVLIILSLIDCLKALPVTEFLASCVFRSASKVAIEILFRDLFGELFRVDVLLLYLVLPIIDFLILYVNFNFYLILKYALYC
jgi:hypothetical protein